MGIVLYSESGAPEIFDALGGTKRKIERRMLPDAFDAQTCFDCDADVVLLDCGIDVDNGLKALEGLKSRCPGTPVIFVTDEGSEETAIHAFRTGARDYLTKPLDLNHLQETVSRLVSVRRTTRERRLPIQARSKQEGGSNGDGTLDLPESVIKVMEYIEEHFTEDFTLDDVCELAGLSKFHFIRIFKRYTGMTPVRYRTNLRLERAKDLLRSTRSSVARIASEIGFRDMSNFIRHFKEDTGLTPRDYRKRARSAS